MSRLAIASWTLSWIGAVAVVVGVGVIPALGRGAESGIEHPTLVQSPDCGHRLSDTVRNGHGRPPMMIGDATTQTLTVTVLRTAILQLDARGHVVAALTNTGCAPRAADDVYVSLIDGTVTKSSSIDVGRIAWIGNFTSAGVYQPQRR